MVDYVRVLQSPAPSPCRVRSCGATPAKSGSSFLRALASRAPRPSTSGLTPGEVASLIAASLAEAEAEHNALVAGMLQLQVEIQNTANAERVQLLARITSAFKRGVSAGAKALESLHKQRLSN